MNDSYVKNTKLYVVAVILVMLAVIVLTIGYSAFVSDFSITNVVSYFRIIPNTRVMGVTTNSAYVSNLDYSTTSINSTAEIPNEASVTFQVTITTFENVPMALSNISVMNGNTVINNVDILPTFNDTYIKICNTSNACTLNSSKVVDVAVMNNTGSTISTDNFSVNFTFTPFYTVTYNGSIIGDVLQNGTFTYEFQNDMPSSVTVDTGTCGSASISNDTLIITNVTSDLVLTGSSISGSGTGTEQDPYQSSGSTYDTTVVQTGYNIFNDAPGAPKVNAVVATSSGVTTTTINRFEFTDTGLNGVEIGTVVGANPVMNTGVLAFNSENSAFSIHIKFKANLKTNQGKYILAALQKSGSSYSGFTLHVLDSNTPTLNISTYINKNYNGAILNPNISLVLTSNADATSNAENVYEVVVSYDQAYGGQSFKYRCIGNNCRSTSEQSAQKKNIPTGLTAAEITIGGNGLNTTNNAVDIKILELQICKGQFTNRNNGDYSCAS